MRSLALLGLFTAVLLVSPGCVSQPIKQKNAATPHLDEIASIAKILDDWHDAAARADESRYFAHFAEEAVFLGTDASERWELAAFRSWAQPYFSNGKAWSFRATRRAITVAETKVIAWFDEDLDTGSLGPARGSGVMIRDRNQTWKIVHYNLALTIPNARLDEVKRLLAGESGASPMPANPPN